MLGTIKAFLESDKLDPSTIASQFVRDFRAGQLSGLGSSTLKALNDLVAGAHWALSGRKGEWAAGNGAAMRVAPLAFILEIQSASDRVLLRDICRITHHNDEAFSGALAVVAAINYSVTDLNKIAEQLPDSVTRDRIYELSSLPDDSSISDAAACVGTSGYTAESVPFSVFSACRCPHLSFEERLITVIEQGGDTDTNASIVGQIVGARIGQERIPSELKALLPGRNEMVKLAQKVACRTMRCS